MPRYAAAVFDLDGTLVSEEDGVEQATALVAHALRERGHPVPDARLEEARTTVVREAMAANRGNWPAWLSREEWLRRAFARVDAPAELAPEMAAVYLQGRIDGLALLDHAIELLEAVAARTRLGMITNGGSVEQRLKITTVGLNHYFPEPLISDEVGAQKPDPAIFQKALSTLEVAASDAVYIGNSFVNDIEGAAAVGMDTIWLDHYGSGPPPQAATTPTLTTTSLRAVREFLGA
jgi:HAD superfamily hydrolase (TIGR01549 family)